MPNTELRERRFNWERDELILALDLYFDVDPARVRPDSDEIVELSALLSRLHTAADAPEKFRNVNGVYMKLQNFRRLDPSVGVEGLPHGAKSDQAVWNEFAGDRTKLRAAASEI